MVRNFLFVLFLLAVCISKSQARVTNVFNVLNYGAIADGKTDNKEVYNHLHSFSFLFLNLFDFDYLTNLLFSCK